MFNMFNISQDPLLVLIFGTGVMLMSDAHSNEHHYLNEHHHSNGHHYLMSITNEHHSFVMLRVMLISDVHSNEHH